MGPSTLSSWALLIARALAARGIDAQSVFRRAGVAPDKLQDPNARYPLAGVQRLWALATEVTGDACFGLEVGRSWHPTTFHALGYCALASASLREALLYVVRYCKVVSTGARVQLERQGSEVAVRLSSRLRELAVPTPSSRPAIQAALVALAVLCREARGGSIAIRRVTFAHRDATCRERLQRFFQCRVVFGAPNNALVLRTAEVDAPLPTGNPALARINEQLVADYHAQLESADLVERVRSQLMRLLPSGHVGQATVAKSLHLSLRSLQRKLREEGTSFRKLVDQTRRRLAQQYAKDSTLSASEVAYLLGFSDPSSLSRAMRRWQQ
ncbi:MAG TPA: AraC family transcriptional regulator [Burkholderiales bacterium]|nr:AraC family transcriptional regulator [Burkholderiales bacterium]